ncbi:hypothetical protein PR003_g31747 [Phytophthora rubi]|uniref:Uncharacterized protein n=1 Tax=Phytophthora rubi TaxID=129364 RepID=A0A6A3GR79_9STRA|nr:hypothetical protein PR002_g30553 [Phytophthora rubi]KAE9267519.1 hypothetical protein PR003_g31747 [Phytophthora rubi]
MSLPDVELFTNLASCRRSSARGITRQVRASSHAVTLARHNLWTEECLEELIARDIEAHVERVELTDDDEAKDD